MSHRSSNRQGKLFRRVNKVGGTRESGTTVKAAWHIVKESAKRIGVGEVGAARSEVDLCSALPCFGRRAQQIQFLLRGTCFGADDRRYLGCKQRISSAVNDRIGSGRTRPVGQARTPPVPTLPAKANTPELTCGNSAHPGARLSAFGSQQLCHDSRNIIAAQDLACQLRFRPESYAVYRSAVPDPPISAHAANADEVEPWWVCLRRNWL